VIAQSTVAMVDLHEGIYFDPRITLTLKGSRTPFPGVAVWTPEGPMKFCGSRVTLAEMILGPVRPVLGSLEVPLFHLAIVGTIVL
jgi:hypothetical protein